MRDASVDDVGLGDARVEGDEAGLNLGEHALADDAAFDEIVDLRVRERGGVRVGRIGIGADAVGVGEHNELFGFERGGDVARGGVGVHVQLADRVGLGAGARRAGAAGQRDGGDDRDETVLAERGEQHGVHFGDGANIAEIDDRAGDGIGQGHPIGHEHAGAEGVQPDSARAGGVQIVHQELVALVHEHMLGDLERGAVGVAPALDEVGLDAGLGHGLGDGLSAAVDEHRADAHTGHECDIGEQGAHALVVFLDGAADLDNDDLVAEALDVAVGLDEGGGFDDGGVHGRRV